MCVLVYVCFEKPLISEDQRKVIKIRLTLTREVSEEGGSSAKLKLVQFCHASSIFSLSYIGLNIMKYFFKKTIQPETHLPLFFFLYSKKAINDRRRSRRKRPAAQLAHMAVVGSLGFGVSSKSQISRVRVPHVLYSFHPHMQSPQIP